MFQNTRIWSIDTQIIQCLSKLKYHKNIIFPLVTLSEEQFPFATTRLLKHRCKTCQTPLISFPNFKQNCKSQLISEDKLDSAQNNMENCDSCSIKLITQVCIKVDIDRSAILG